MSRAAAEVGSTANSYQILAKLAAGGMAEIFLARGASVAGVERYCVLKRILRDRASDVHFVKMFLDEARLAAQLQHPNIAQVHDIGKLGDSFFFTMEYVHGETVRALLHRAQGLRRMLPLHAVLTIVAGTAAGLHHAHERLGLDGRPLGIVHRDVSPSNLMVSYEGGVKVVDFGVAKAADRASDTKSGTVKGKISYLSPEQCRGKPVDRRSDLFSLGICFWEMLTTERLYKRATDFENMNAIVGEPTPAPSTRRADIPPDIDALVLRLLAKDPEQRFQTADALIEAIEAVSARTGTVLSGSALGRLVRELFGQRPEPWLELDAQHDHAEPVTVTGEPIPREFGVGVAERVDQQLAGVIDLSVRAQATESIDVLPSASIALQAVSPRASNERSGGKLGLPLAAPPLTDPGIVPHRPTLPLDGALPPARPHETVSLSMVPLSAELGGDARALSPPPLEVGTTTAPSGSFASSGPHVPARVAASLRMPVRRRTWPLYAVIGGAALAGSVAMIVMMRSPAPTGDAAIARPASSVTVVPIVEPIPAPAAKLAEPTVAERAPAPVAEAVPAAAIAAPVRAAPKAASPASDVAVVRPAAARNVPRVEAGARAVRPADATVRPADASAEPGADLARAYDAAKYEQVLALCSGHPVSAGQAPLCVLAACRRSNEPQARRLLLAVPAARRDALIAGCDALGVSLAAKPAAKPADDCEADPMACQH